MGSAPAYGKRKGWMPRKPAVTARRVGRRVFVTFFSPSLSSEPARCQDFGDGGAYPEILVAQFPLNMGKGEAAGRSSQIVPLTLGADGEVKYDAILTQNLGKDQSIRSSYMVRCSPRPQCVLSLALLSSISPFFWTAVWREGLTRMRPIQDLVPVDITKDDAKRQLPTEEAVKEAADKTRLALNLLVNNKTAAAQSTFVAKQNRDAEFIRCGARVHGGPNPFLAPLTRTALFTPFCPRRAVVQLHAD